MSGLPEEISILGECSGDEDEIIEKADKAERLIKNHLGEVVEFYHSEPLPQIK